MSFARFLHTRGAFAALILFLLAACSASAPQVVQAPQSDSGPRNVIIFVADGAGPAMFTLARDFVRHRDGREELIIDGILVGSTRTYATDARITDSAAGATAIATGVKSYNGAIAMDAERRPIATVLEAARERGMATGLVATTRITHATPASFSAHVTQRGMEPEIAEQQAAAGVDLLLGGGRRFFLPAEAGGSRTDGKDLLEVFRSAGYTVANTRSEYDAIRQTPAVALLSMDSFDYEIDRDAGREPSLAEMTQRAIDLLRHDPEGFLLMVEGSRIDHAAHGNDPVGVLHDMLAYDEAIGVALDFARRDGQTLLVSVSDHETGGLTLGRDIDSGGRGEGFRPSGRSARGMYTWHPDILERVTSSTEPIMQALRAGDSTPAAVFRTFAGIDDLTDAEAAWIARVVGGEGRIDHAAGEIISRRAGIGWTTGGHTAVDVPTFAFGPGSSLLHGHQDNTVVGQAVIRLMGFDMEPLNARLRQTIQP